MLTLSHQIDARFDEAVALLIGRGADRRYVAAIGAIIERISVARADLTELSRIPLLGSLPHPLEVLDTVREHARQLADTAVLLQPDDREAQDLLAAIQRAYQDALVHLAASAPQQDTDEIATIVIGSDLLYQAHSALFPAERMLAIAGRRSGTTVFLGAGFDVTGHSSAGYVRADPDRLARALISMDLSGTFLASWWHSHPGRGALATCPSLIDLNQQDDWLREFWSSLLGAILVEDGWLRLWGAALEEGRIEVQVVGPGVVEEDRHEHLYRLEG